MSKLKLGINGLGRIGRTILREIINRNESDVEVVAINNPGNPKTYAHLLQYDSVHGTFDHKVSTDGDTLRIGEKELRIYAELDPMKIDWSSEEVDIVIDATGVFKDKDGLSKHLRGTVKKVIMCAPGKNLDGTFVVGINHETYDNEKHHVISNASCTTNCLAPVAKVLNDSFGIINGFMTTVHAYTSDQKLLDGSHSDLRRGRAAALSMVPTTTGAAKAVGLVIPSLEGKLDGFAIRVPTPNVSFVDLTVRLEKKARIEDINSELKKASDDELKGILRYEDLPLVSADFLGMRESSAVDALMTNVIDDQAKVVAWYDNEAGFSNRVIDLAKFVGSKFNS